MNDIFPYELPPQNTVIHASSLVDILDYKLTQYPLPVPYNAKSNPLFDAEGSLKDREIDNILFNLAPI